jgi:precorrin-6x reductase
MGLLVIAGSLFRTRIAHVVKAITQEEMVGATAQRRIAAMADEHAFRDWADEALEHESMHKFAAEHPVTLIVPPTHPKPAALSAIDLCIEPFAERSTRSTNRPVMGVAAKLPLRIRRVIREACAAVSAYPRRHLAIVSLVTLQEGC